MVVTSPGHSLIDSSATILTSVTIISDPHTAEDVSTPEATATEPEDITQEQETTNTMPQSKPMPPAHPIGEAHITTTDSMVTVRLSDAEGLRGIPSPTPTLKLVTDENTEGEPEQELSRSSSPVLTGRVQTESPTAVTPSRRFSVSSVESESESQRKGVDWEGLERTEDEHTSNDDESEEVCYPSPSKLPIVNNLQIILLTHYFQKTAFLLARLERENSRLEKDPKAAHMAAETERPPSIRELKNIVKNADPEKLRYSQLPMPPITDLDFYAALVADYPKCAAKLPYLVSKKIRGGVPPPLRGVVWVSMSGARDSNLEGLYDQLLGETSPYEHMIFKDIGRTGLEMFRQEGGEGQRMLGRVLRAFSIYDTQIGYCQGLALYPIH